MTPAVTTIGHVLVKALPRIMAAESLLAAIFYAVNRDWRHAFYWGSCASITISATLL